MASFALAITRRHESDDPVLNLTGPGRGAFVITLDGSIHGPVYPPTPQAYNSGRNVSI